MFRQFLRAKIHEVVVTSTDDSCDGSIGIDKKWLIDADIAPYEKVLVADCDNGNRFETYVVPMPYGSGETRILGATAQLSAAGHKVNILSFGFTECHIYTKVEPNIVKPNDTAKKTT